MNDVNEDPQVQTSDITVREGPPALPEGGDDEEPDLEDLGFDVATRMSIDRRTAADRKLDLARSPTAQPRSQCADLLKPATLRDITGDKRETCALGVCVQCSAELKTFGSLACQSTNRFKLHVSINGGKYSDPSITLRLFVATDPSKSTQEASIAEQERGSSKYGINFLVRFCSRFRRHLSRRIQEVYPYIGDW
jgi:hypothetical protein